MPWNEVLTGLAGLIATISLGAFGYIIKQLDGIKRNVGSLNEWKARAETAGKYERKDIDSVSGKIENLTTKVDAVNNMQNLLNTIVGELKSTMVKTWDKVLDLEKELQRLEARVNELSRVVFNKQSN